MPLKDALDVLKAAETLGRQWYNVYMQVYCCIPLLAVLSSLGLSVCVHA